MPLSLERQNAYRARYARLRVGWQPATARYEALIRAHLRPGMRVLDVGCGRGGVLEQLQDVLGDALGVDPDHRSLVEHRLPHLPRAVALADALPLPAASVDMVISSWVLEHLERPERTFAEVARVLRPEGWFIFLAPGAWSLPALLNRSLKPLQRRLVPLLYGRAAEDAFPVFYRANTHCRLAALAEGAGLELREFYAVEDPTYFAFHVALFYANVALSALLPRAMAEHLIGVCRKPA